MDSRFRGNDMEKRGNDEGGAGMVRWGNHDCSWSPYPELRFKLLHSLQSILLPPQQVELLHVNSVAVAVEG